MKQFCQVVDARNALVRVPSGGLAWLATDTSRIDDSQPYESPAVWDAYKARAYKIPYDSTNTIVELRQLDNAKLAELVPVVAEGESRVVKQKRSGCRRGITAVH